MKLFISIVSVITAIALPHAAFAWSDLGHQATAEVAQRHLSEKGLKLVRDILGNGPLAEASTFGDMVKSDSSYSEFAGMHFVEIDPLWVTYDRIPEYLRVQRDADTILQIVPAKFFSMDATAALFNANQRRDLFKFLIHVVGDVHHPLHVGNSYDRGGTWCDIKYPGNDGQAKQLSSTNLHAFWDNNLVGYTFHAQGIKDPNFKMPKYQGFSELVDLILKDQDIAAMKPEFDKIAKEPVLQWYKQSQALHPVTYPDAKPVNHPSERTYCKHLERDEKGIEKKDDKGVTIVIPASGPAEVDQAYMNAAAEAIKLQILKGGLRLAGLINKMAEAQYPGIIEPDQKPQDIKKVLEQLVNFTK